jgi:hypothetical protein
MRREVTKMLAQAYEGYFNNGQFYVSGRAIRIPERKRVFLAVLGDKQQDKQEAWNEFKRMVKDSEHENDLLDSDAFLRRDSGRELINFADEV